MPLASSNRLVVVPDVTAVGGDVDRGFCNGAGRAFILHDGDQPARFADHSEYVLSEHGSPPLLAAVARHVGDLGAPCVVGVGVGCTDAAYRERRLSSVGVEDRAV